MTVLTLQRSARVRTRENGPENSLEGPSWKLKLHSAPFLPGEGTDSSRPSQCRKKLEGGREEDDKGQRESCTASQLDGH